jgi:proteic killer suppression protein
VIQGFRDREAERIFHRERSKRYGSIERAAFRKLRAIHAARLLTDLIHPPDNRLEALHGDREDQYSIRISAQ